MKGQYHATPPVIDDHHDAEVLIDSRGRQAVYVSGNLVSVSTSITRPADVNAYAAGDVVADATSNPTVTVFAGCARSVGEAGHLVQVILVDSANQATKGLYELWLFSATYGQDADNAVFTPTDAECATLQAIIPLNTSYVGDATAGAVGNAVYTSGSIDIPFVCAAAQTSLWGALVVRNAYTPVSAEVFTMTLVLDQE